MKITIPIIPTAQMRARHSAVNGYSRTYKAKKQTDKEDTIKTFLLQFRPEMPLEGPIMLGVKAYLEHTVTGKDVAMCMALLKFSRESYSHKQDNLLDAAGYIGLAADMEAGE